jgi:hypothetical protein
MSPRRISGSTSGCGCARRGSRSSRAARRTRAWTGTERRVAAPSTRLATWRDASVRDGRRGELGSRHRVRDRRVPRRARRGRGARRGRRRPGSGGDRRRVGRGSSRAADPRRWPRPTRARGSRRRQSAVRATGATGQGRCGARCRSGLRGWSVGSISPCRSRRSRSSKCDPVARSRWSFRGACSRNRTRHRFGDDGSPRMPSQRSRDPSGSPERPSTSRCLRSPARRRCDCRTVSTPRVVAARLLSARSIDRARRSRAGRNDPRRVDPARRRRGDRHGRRLARPWARQARSHLRRAR